ncbi:MAG: hypothetical protein ACP5HM_02125 [Anaerolineae bacterium]
MKKVLGILSIVAVLATVLLVSGAYAFPTGTWVSGVTVANLSSDTATVNIKFYNQDGSVALDYEGGTISGNGSKTWYLPSAVSDLGDGFIGSAVVSADQQVAAIVNTQLPSGTDPARVGTSVGVNSPSEKVYATQVMKGYYGWNSYCAVQNTGSSSVNVTATYYDSSGAVADTESANISGYASYIFDQSENSDLASGFNGSAQFEGDADHPLAVVCNFYNSGDAADTSQFHSYNGLGAGGDTLYVPRVVKDYYNYQSGLKIQNIGSEALEVTVTYNIGGNTYTQDSPSIGVGQSWGPYMGDESQLPASMSGVSGSGSAIIEIKSPNANKAIIATVNEDNRVDPAGRGVTYAAALAADASDTLVFPQVTAEYYGYSSGIQVQKVTSGEVNCTASYSASGNVSSFADGFTLTDASPSWSQFAPNASGMNAGNGNDDYNGAVTINCTGGKVIGIANLSYRYDVDSRYGTLTGDSFTTARGIAK